MYALGVDGVCPLTSERPEVANEVHVSGFRHGFDGFTCRKLIKALAGLVTWQWLRDSKARVLSPLRKRDPDHSRSPSPSALSSCFSH